MAKGKKPPGPTTPPEDNSNVFDVETRRAQNRVAKVRDRLSKAMEDPDMRKQMVEAIRQMMQREK